jgi:hypothetical protein
MASGQSNFYPEPDVLLWLEKQPLRTRTRLINEAIRQVYIKRSTLEERLTVLEAKMCACDEHNLEEPASAGCRKRSEP